ncbi:hypothetical protein FOZ62_022531 [Perkinsus olseni]|uniref:Uncharacterized protein n=1 Tax=Perkinsus olseni TaxID=32597 RepID=A0A7J6U7C7_PEROL|nr:hypothetical protein FOZ62_022531 [Perkinsus olseni]
MTAPQRSCILCEEERAKRMVAEAEVAKIQLTTGVRQRAYIGLLTELEALRRRSEEGSIREGRAQWLPLGHKAIPARLDSGGSAASDGSSDATKESVELMQYLEIVLDWILNDFEVDLRKKALARLNTLNPRTKALPDPKRPPHSRQRRASSPKAAVPSDGLTKGPNWDRSHKRVSYGRDGPPVFRARRAPPKDEEIFFGGSSGFQRRGEGTDEPAAAGAPARA